MREKIPENIQETVFPLLCLLHNLNYARDNVAMSLVYRNFFPRMDFNGHENRTIVSSFRTAVTVFLCYVPYSYMILAPAAMANEKDSKSGAAKCFEEIGLDPDSYRIGHTKAS
jgi:hypothetical protein